LKITHLEIIKVPPSWVWLKIHTDKEIYGIGEPYLENHPEPVISEVKRLENILIGEDPTNVEKLWKKMYEYSSGYYGGPIKMSAISGIDIALWDIAGKAAGLPIYKMLGGKVHEKIKIYRALGHEMPHFVEPGDPYMMDKRNAKAFFSNFYNIKPEMYKIAAEKLTEEWGFKALKMHISLGDDLESTNKVDEIVKRFVAAKEGVGKDIDIAIDLHNPNPIIGKQLIKALEPHRPLFIEEPMPVERVDILREVKNDTYGTIAAGERWMGKWIFFDALKQNSINVMQPDICHAGGITESKKIASIGEAAYAKLALHCPLSIIALAACFQVDTCTTNFLVQEHNEVNDYRKDNKTIIGNGYIKEPYILDKDGCINVGDKPGLGIEINDDGLEKIMSKKWSINRG
tara:strand:+ start:226 stop:1428 length:1203 start_codon:yes stop_codon:yes gene_type:complete